jgi:hypothetical protein
VALACPRCVQKVRVELRKCFGENGRHDWTRTSDLYRVKEVQQPVIDSKGVNNRRNRQNRNTRRNLLPNCYQKLGKWVRGRIVGDRLLHFTLQSPRCE